MTAYTQQTAAFEGINNPRDREITTLMRVRDLETVKANCTWIPQRHRDDANAKIAELNFKIELLKDDTRRMNFEASIIAAC